MDGDRREEAREWDGSSFPLLGKRLGNGRGVRDTLALHFGQWSPKEISLCTFDLIIITSKFSFHVHFLHQIGLLLFYVMIFQKDHFDGCVLF